MHRDPETGQFLAHDDDEPIDLTYADHEFLNFRIDATNQAGSNTVTTQEFDVEDDVLDLENDELGMLAWMTAGVSLAATATQVDDESLGGAEAFVEIGSNLAGNEFLGDNNQDSGVQVTEDSSSVFNVTRANDEPGLWAALNPSITTPFTDDPSGTGGGAHLGHDRVRRVYYDETVGGPYIDSTDDVTVGTRLQRGRTEAAISVRIVAQMAFVVFEYENRRAEFAPYGPYDPGD